MAEDTFPVPAIAPELVRELAATAAGFIESLNPDQRARALLAFDSEERHDWHYVPRQRPGLALRDMDETQRAAALVLLSVALSEAGGSKALAIMQRETILKRSDPQE